MELGSCGGCEAVPCPPGDRMLRHDGSCRESAAEHPESREQPAGQVARGHLASWAPRIERG